MPFKKKKSLGQNFLKNTAVVKTMVSAGAVSSEDLVLEIGPGQGALTRALLETGARVIAIEKDDRLIAELKAIFANEEASGRFTLIHADALEVDIASLTKGEPFKFIANIPYYITGALMRMVLETPHRPQSIVVLVQKEVAERIVARDKKESVLSLSVKAYGIPKIERKVPRGAFHPVPNVDSAVLSIGAIGGSFFSGISEQMFFEWIKAGFAHKRKKLISNLETVASREDLKDLFSKARIDESARAEDLSLDDWKRLLLLNSESESRKA